MPWVVDRGPASRWEKAARWAAAALWFGIILSLSQESFASTRTEGWLGQFLAGWGLELGPLLGLANLIVRKCAHFVEYATLGVLVHRAWQRTWPASDALAAAISIVILAAGLDELGQTRLLVRTGAAKDVVLDACGGAVGAYLASRLWGETRGADSG